MRFAKYFPADSIFGGFIAVKMQKISKRVVAHEPMPPIYCIFRRWLFSLDLNNLSKCVAQLLYLPITAKNVIKFKGEALNVC
jgi:hypothetical protein